MNGSVTTTGHTFTKTSGGVGMLSDYFDQAHQAALMTEAQTCQNNISSLFDLSPGQDTLTQPPVRCLPP